MVSPSGHPVSSERFGRFAPASGTLRGLIVTSTSGDPNARQDCAPIAKRLLIVLALGPRTVISADFATPGPQGCRKRPGGRRRPDEQKHSNDGVKHDSILS